MHIPDPDISVAPRYICLSSCTYTTTYVHMHVACTSDLYITGWPAFNYLAYGMNALDQLEYSKMVGPSTNWGKHE